MEIKKIAAHYRQYLARMIKQSTRADYTKRLEMLVCYASMQGITAIEDIDFTQFLEWVFIGRGVAPRTRNNYRTCASSFCEWCRQREYLKGHPLEGIKPLRETPKQSPVKHYVYSSLSIVLMLSSMCSFKRRGSVPLRSLSITQKQVRYIRYPSACLIVLIHISRTTITTLSHTPTFFPHIRYF